MNYFDRLRFYREKLGLNQTQMGKLLGIPQTTYSNYENGGRKLPPRVIEKITRNGLNSDWLLTGTINRNYTDYLNGCDMMTNVENSPPLDRAGAAQKLSVPVAFIDAIFNGEITPSDEFYRRLCEALGLPANETSLDDMRAALANHKTDSSRISTVSGPPPDGYRVVPQEERVEKLRTQLDTCYERYFELQEENRILRTEIERLREKDR